MARTRGRFVVSALIIYAILLLPGVSGGGPLDPTRTYHKRWLYSHGYAAVEIKGGFVLVYFDNLHDPAKPYAYSDWAWHGFSLNRWRGGSGWNNDWQYTAVRVSPWLLRSVWPFPIADDPD